MSQFDPFLIIFMAIYLVAGVFLFLLLYRLYHNYKETKYQDVLDFLIGLLLLSISNIVFLLRRPAYEFLGMPQLGDLLTIILQIPSETGVLFISAFAMRFTFPEKTKVIIPVVAIVLIIKWFVEGFIIFLGFPHYFLVDYNIVYSLEYALIRLGMLIPLYVTPPAVFFYYGYKVRETSKPKSNRSIWLGFGMLCFAVPFLLVPIAVVTLGHIFRLLEIFVLFAAIIFYIGFTMPDWFKTFIGIIDEKD